MCNLQIKCNLSNFLIVVGVMFKKSLSVLCHQVLPLTFRSLVYFELIFSYSFACGYPVFPAPFVRLSFHHWMVLASSFDHICEGLYQGCLLYPIGLFVCLYASATLLITIALVSFDIRKCKSSSFVIFQVFSLIG